MKAQTQALMTAYLMCGSAYVAAPVYSPEHYSKAQKARQGGKKRGKGKPNAR